MQNLKPNSERTPEELREQTRKGGKASGKARKLNADLRKAAQAVLDGTYTDKNGKKFTGYDAAITGLVANLTDYKGKNWAKAMDLLIQLTGAGKSDEEKALLKAQADMMKAKVALLTSADTQTLDKLDDILKGMESLAKAEPETK